MKNKTLHDKQTTLLFILIVLFWFAQYAHISFQTVFLAGIQVSADFIGLILGAYGVSQMLLRLPVGVMADSGGNHRLFIRLGMLASMGAGLLRMFVQNGVGFLAANILSGVASAMWISFLVYYTGFYDGENQRMATTKVFLGNTLGIALAFVSSALLYPRFQDSGVSMTVVAATGMLAGLIGLGITVGLRKPEKRVVVPPVGFLLTVLKNKKLLFFSLLALVVLGVQSTTVMSFTTQIVEDRGGSRTMVGLSTIVFMASSVCFARIGSMPSFIKRYSKQNLVPTIFFLLTVYAIFVSHVNSIALIFCLQVLPGIAFGILLGILTTEAMSEVPQEKKSTAMGAYQSIYAIGMTLLPAMSGRIAEFHSIGRAFIVLGCITFTAMVVSFLYYRRFTLNS